MTELKPMPEHERLPYHWLCDTRFASSDKQPLFEPMLWHNSLWYQIGDTSSLNTTQYHHWRYHGPCIPTALPLDLDSDATMTALASTIAHAFWADGTQETIARAVLAKLKELGR